MFAALLTPLLIVLGLIVGIGIGTFLLFVVRRVSPGKQEERDLEVARATARRTADATLRTLFERHPTD